MIASAVEAAFDTLAEQYDALWSYSAVGRQQRAAVWRWVDPLFHAGDRVLDLGCGTGVDAEHFMQRRVEVYGIDASQKMVQLARDRGVDAHQLAIEALGDLNDPFDGAVSNFGALNCVSDLESVALALGRLIRIGGHVAICLAGRCCAWETAHYLLRRKTAKAFRRWNSSGSEASLGVHVEYPPVRHLERLFRPDFRLIRWCGIGLCVPPSYVRGISEATIARLAAADRQLAHRRVFRALADHWLLVFQRIC
jgi:ubiquinone/menaquinone biosynthesis C-methylase UbiE